MPKNKILNFKNKKNNLGFSFIPLLFLIISILVVGLFSYNFFQNKQGSNVLQSETKELFFSYYFFNENKNIIELYVSGEGVPDFVNNLPKPIRVSRVSVDGKSEVFEIVFFKDSKGNYLTRFGVSPDTVHITFLDFKLANGKVSTDGIAPWKYNYNSNRIEKSITGKTFLDVSMKFTGKTPNTGTLTFNFIESAETASEYSFSNEIRRNGIVIGSQCLELTCPKNIKDTPIKPRLTKTKTGFVFSVNVNNLTKYIYMPQIKKDRLEIRSLPEGWGRNQNNDGIDGGSEELTYVGFNTPNNSTISFSMSGHSEQFFQLLKDIRTRGLDIVTCTGDVCSTSSIKPVLRTQNNYLFTFSIPVTRNTTSVSFKSNYLWSLGLNWLPNNNQNWQVKKDKLGLERFSRISPPKVTIIESKFNQSKAYYFTVSGYGVQYDSVVSSLRNGIKSNITYYPALRSCNIPYYGTCQFNIISATNLSSFQFLTDVRLDFIKIPEGWKVNAQGNGIYK